MSQPMINRLLVGLLAVGALATGIPTTGAAAADKPRLGSARQQDFAIEKRYQFYVRGYRRPVVFNPADQTFGAREVTARPEELAMRALAARAGGRVEEYLELWTADAREALLSEWAEEGITQKRQGERWRAALSGLHAELTHHVDFDITDLIRYRLFDPATGDQHSTGEFAFHIADDGLWRIFEPDDPIFLANWRFDASHKTLDLPGQGSEQ